MTVMLNNSQKQKRRLKIPLKFRLPATVAHILLLFALSRAPDHLCLCVMCPIVVFF